MTMIQQSELYQPDKYRVILGNGENIGFCTLWNEPEKIIEEHPLLLEKSAIIGTLYSRQGVNIIIRNLALNPQINRLYLWNNGALSCSPFGISGKEILLKLWESGVSDTGEIPGIDFKIEKEIDGSIVNKIIKHVNLEEVSDPDMALIISKLEVKKIAPYMDSIRFPDSVPEKIDVFPSEKVGFLVRGKTVIDAWVRVVDRIMRYGTIKGTQYGNQQRELLGITWVIENEDPDNPMLDTDWPESLKKTIGLNIDSIQHYRSVFLSPDVAEGIKYTYGNRLMKYPDVDGKTIDQIKDVIVREFKSSIDTRRAIATTMVPPSDWNSKEPPCISTVQALQTNNKLHLLVTVRSHDIFKAAIPNAFGLRALQKKIVDEVGLEMGSLQITSQSAHIYEAEWDDAKKLVECALWEREPRYHFDPSISADPRGLFVISLKKGRIYANFKTPTGEELLNIDGVTALEVGKKIAQLELINSPEHLLDIGSELQKAEIALSQDILYTQDKPLMFTGPTREKQVESKKYLY
jgi:thymidylate synthase